MTIGHTSGGGCPDATCLIPTVQIVRDAPLVHHGVIGQGLIDYDAIFSILGEVRFDGWISIEDGQDQALGMEHLRASALFLAGKLQEHGLR